eukprot:comp19237_c0_seq1/m.36044 comp19237_c0_seq1/g.36044  ORF comp19237_c0_seq1/g.36044 comp19237_c0_seq1/m.36044 type:complete len:185 (-) comp19237_c0_seq1:53-607(-)
MFFLFFSLFIGFSHCASFFNPIDHLTWIQWDSSKNNRNSAAAIVVLLNSDEKYEVIERFVKDAIDTEFVSDVAFSGRIIEPDYYYNASRIIGLLKSDKINTVDIMQKAAKNIEKSNNKVGVTRAEVVDYTAVIYPRWDSYEGIGVLSMLALPYLILVIVIIIQRMNPKKNNKKIQKKRKNSDDE